MRNLSWRWDSDGNRTGGRIMRQPQFIGAAFIALLSQTGLLVGAVNALGFIGVGTLGLGVGYAAVIGISIGLSLLLAPKPPKPDDVQSNVRQATPVRTALYGKGRLGGPWIFAEAKDGRFYKVIALASRKLSAITAFLLDDNVVTVDGSNIVTSSPYNSRVYLDKRLGLATETAYSHLASAFSGVWTSDHRGDGVASVYVAFASIPAKEIGNVAPNGVNTMIRADCNGVAVFDPTDGAHDIEDPDTWEFSENLANCVTDYLWHQDGMRLPVSVLTTPLALAGWEQAVDDCNDAITLKAGGTEARYRLWGSYAYSERPADVLSRFLRAGNARLKVTPDGGLHVEVGKWSAPTVTIDTDMILAFDQVGRGKDILQTANTIFSQFTSSTHGYQATDADPWIDDADVSDRGEIAVSPDFICAPSHGQCRRLMKIEAHRANPEWVGTFVCNLAALEAFGERFINLEYTPFGISGTFEVMDFQFVFGEHSTLRAVSLTVQSISSTAYDWTAASEEGTAPAYTESTTSGYTETAGTLTVTIVRELINGVYVPYADLEWDAPTTEALVAVPQLKKSADSVWLDVPYTAGENQTRTPALADDTDYDFRYQLRKPGGDVVDTSDVETEHVTADITSPGDLSGVSVTAALMGHALFTFTAPATQNVRSIAVYRVTAGGSLNRATDLAFRLYVAPGQTFTDYVYGDDGPHTNLITDPGFDNAGYWTFGGNWSVNSATPSKAQKTVAGANTLSRGSLSFSAGTTYRFGMTVSGNSAGLIDMRVTGGTQIIPINDATGNGVFLGAMAAVTGNNTLAFEPNASWNAGSQLDDIRVFAQTGGMAQQGNWDFHIEAENWSGTPGTTSVQTSKIIY